MGDSLINSRETILFKKFLGFANTATARDITAETAGNANPITFLNNWK